MKNLKQIGKALKITLIIVFWLVVVTSPVTILATYQVAQTNKMFRESEECSKKYSEWTKTDEYKKSQELYIKFLGRER